MPVPIELRDGVRTTGRFGISSLGTGNGGSVGWTFWLPTVR